MSDIVFIKDENDYNEFSKIRPINYRNSLKVKFICSQCNKENIRTFKSLKLPFICRNCTIKNFVNTPEYINKRAATNIRKFGTDNPWKSKAIQEKRKETWVKMYGSDNPQKSKEIREQRDKTEQNHLIEKYNAIIPEHIIEYDYKTFTCHCPTCNTYFKIDKDLFYTRVITHKTIVCTTCNPISNCGSGKQAQLKNFISEIYKGNIIYNDKNILNGKEIDIYLPELKLGFEFDGTYWHADPRFYKPEDLIEHKKVTAEEIWNRDKEKDLICKNLGITLIRVKEYDWINNQDLEKSKIIEKLEKCKNNNKI